MLPCFISTWNLLRGLFGQSAERKLQDDCCGAGFNQLAGSFTRRLVHCTGTGAIGNTTEPLTTFMHLEFYFCGNPSERIASIIARHVSSNIYYEG